MKELENNNEKLFPAGKKIPFEVPQGYFDDLPMRIQNLCVNQQTTNSQSIPMFQVIKTQLGLAFGFIALAFLAFAGYFYLKPTDTHDVLSKDDYIEIVKKNIYEYDEARLIEESDGYISYDTLKYDQKEEMIKYLLDQNIDYVTLMEQY